MPTNFQNADTVAKKNNLQRKNNTILPCRLGVPLNVTTQPPKDFEDFCWLKISASTCCERFVEWKICSY